MAYLKGGSFVDGKLYVQDSIVVNRLEDNNGNPFPYYSFSTENTKKNTIEDRFVRFKDANGGLDISNMSLKVVDGNVMLNFFEGQLDSDDNAKPNSAIYIKSAPITLTDYEWDF